MVIEQISHPGEQVLDTTIYFWIATSFRKINSRLISHIILYVTMYMFNRDCRTWRDCWPMECVLKAWGTIFEQPETIDDRKNQRNLCWTKKGKKSCYSHGIKEEEDEWKIVANTTFHVLGMKPFSQWRFSQQIMGSLSLKQKRILVKLMEQGYRCSASRLVVRHLLSTIPV